MFVVQVYLVQQVPRGQQATRVPLAFRQVLLVSRIRQLLMVVLVHLV